MSRAEPEGPKGAKMMKWSVRCRGSERQSKMGAFSWQIEYWGGELAKDLVPAHQW